MSKIVDEQHLLPTELLARHVQYLADNAATDPCAARGHSCRCPSPFLEQWLTERQAERATAEDRFRRLFINKPVTG